jgi:hypothetical protein
MNSFIVEGVDIIDAINNALKIADFPDSFDIKIIERGEKSIFCWWKNKPTIIVFSFLKKKNNLGQKEHDSIQSENKKEREDKASCFKKSNFKRVESSQKKPSQREHSYSSVGLMAGQSTVSLLSKEKINELSLGEKKENNVSRAFANQSESLNKNSPKKNITDFCNLEKAEKNFRPDFEGSQNRKKSRYGLSESLCCEGNEKKESLIIGERNSKGNNFFSKDKNKVEQIRTEEGRENNFQRNSQNKQILSRQSSSFNSDKLLSEKSAEVLSSQDAVSEEYVRKIKSVCDEYLKGSTEKNDIIILSHPTSADKKEENLVISQEVMMTNEPQIPFFTPANMTLIENWVKKMSLFIGLGEVTVEYSIETSIFFIRIVNYREFEGIKKKYLYSSIIIFLHDYLKSMKIHFEPSKHKIIIE